MKRQYLDDQAAAATDGASEQDLEAVDGWTMRTCGLRLA